MEKIDIEYHGETITGEVEKAQQGNANNNSFTEDGKEGELTAAYNLLADRVCMAACGFDFRKTVVLDVRKIKDSLKGEAKEKAKKFMNEDTDFLYAYQDKATKKIKAISFEVKAERALTAGNGHGNLYLEEFDDEYHDKNDNLMLDEAGKPKKVNGWLYKTKADYIIFLQHNEQDNKHTPAFTAITEFEELKREWQQTKSCLNGDRLISEKPLRIYVIISRKQLFEAIKNNTKSIQTESEEDWGRKTKHGILVPIKNAIEAGAKIIALPANAAYAQGVKGKNPCIVIPDNMSENDLYSHQQSRNPMFRNIRNQIILPYPIMKYSDRIKPLNRYTLNLGKLSMSNAYLIKPESMSEEMREKFMPEQE